LPRGGAPELVKWASTNRLKLMIAARFHAIIGSLAAPPRTAISIQRI
jgi:hypothetical protein